MIEGRSIVLSAALPSSKTGTEGLRKAFALAKDLNVAYIEYYCEDCPPETVRELLADRTGIFLAGALQKAGNLNPASPEPDERRLAVEQLARCFQFAAASGAAAVMLSSGPRPERVEDDVQCLDCLRTSLLEMHRAQPQMPIWLEPGDRDVEYRHLVGSTAMAVELVRGLREKGLPISLLFDMSHIAQLDEGLWEAWAQARRYTAHIHFANCILNRASSRYGDKHPFFDVADGVYSHDDARRFMRMVAEDPLSFTVGLEMICDQENEERFFHDMLQDTEWFFRDSASPTAFDQIGL